MDSRLYTASSHLEFFAVGGMPLKMYGEVGFSASGGTTWVYCISLDVQQCAKYIHRRFN